MASRSEEALQIENIQDLLDQVSAISDRLTLHESRSTAGRLVHVRNTYVFNAVTGAIAATPTHVIFTLTGRVFVDLITAFCSQTLVSAGTPAMTLGTLGDVDAFISAPTGGGPDLVTGDWWVNAATTAGSSGPLSVVTGGLVIAQRFKLLSENIGLSVPTTAITGGTLVFDCFYMPITDDGKLVATVN